MKKIESNIFSFVKISDYTMWNNFCFYFETYFFIWTVQFKIYKYFKLCKYIFYFKLYNSKNNFYFCILNYAFWNINFVFWTVSFKSFEIKQSETKSENPKLKNEFKTLKLTRVLIETMDVHEEDAPVIFPFLTLHVYWACILGQTLGLGL